MTDFRLKSLEIYNSKPIPMWGADLSDLDVDNIVHYVRQMPTCQPLGTTFPMTSRRPSTDWGFQKLKESP